MRFVVCLFVVLSLSASAAEPRYSVASEWPQLPKDHVMGLCSAVGVDAQNRVFVFHRSGQQWTKPFPTSTIALPTVSVIDGATGKLLRTWGQHLFIMPHGLTVDHDGNLWLTDLGLQQVLKFTPEGKLLLTVGVRGEAGDDAAHFNFPTCVAVLRDGSFYVSDGYRNSRVVKFTASGAFEFQWGSKGTKPGEFNLPHGIALDANGHVYVCDRTNARVQVFDPKGVFLDQWQGPHIGHPYGIDVSASGHVFIVDGGEPSVRQGARGKAMELDAAGQVIDTIGSYGKGPEQFELGHDIAVGPDGAVYVADSQGQCVRKFVPFAQ